LCEPSTGEPNAGPEQSYRETVYDAMALSDCVHNAGPDPRPFAARLPRLDILLDTTGEQDPELARDLARLGRGRLRQVRTYRDVAPALSGFFEE
jgi:hypothetical protein